MTVTVKLPSGGVNEYSRYGDTYCEHPDGSLDVIRYGAKAPYSYAAGSWSEVDGDEQKWKKRRFWQ